MSFEAARPPELDQHLVRLTEEYFPGSKLTDMQFNVGRMEGYANRGLDIIDPLTEQRLYLARPSSLESIKKVEHNIGKIILPPTKDHFLSQVVEIEEIEIFTVQPGMRPLLKTLRHSPYKGGSYTNKLAFDAGRLLGTIHNMDQGLLGLGIESIAVGYSDEVEEDDVALRIVPPLKAPKKEHPISVANFLDSATRSMDPEVRRALKQGFDEGGYRVK